MTKIREVGNSNNIWTGKVAGTFAGLVGAMILTIYEGPDVNLWSTNIGLLKHGNHQAMSSHGSGDQIAGSLLAIASCLSFSIAMVLQVTLPNNIILTVPRR